MFSPGENMRSAPSHDNQNHLLVINMTISLSICLPQGLGCGMNPSPWHRVPAELSPPACPPPPRDAVGRQGARLAGKRAHLTSQAGVKLNSWRIVKSSHKAVSHTPITPAQQGHPLINNSRGPSLHTSLIFMTTCSSRHCSGGRAQGCSFGCLSISVLGFFCYRERISSVLNL